MKFSTKLGVIFLTFASCTGPASSDKPATAVATAGNVSPLGHLNSCNTEYLKQIDALNQEKDAKVREDIKKNIEDITNNLAASVARVLSDIKFIEPTEIEKVKEELKTPKGCDDVLKKLNENKSKGEAFIQSLFTEMTKILRPVAGVTADKSQDALRMFFENKEIFKNANIQPTNGKSLIEKLKSTEYTVESFKSECKPLLDDLCHLQASQQAIKDAQTKKSEDSKLLLYILIGVDVVLVLIAVYLFFSIFLGGEKEVDSFSD